VGWKKGGAFFFPCPEASGFCFFFCQEKKKGNEPTLAKRSEAMEVLFWSDYQIGNPIIKRNV